MWGQGQFIIMCRNLFVFLCLFFVSSGAIAAAPLYDRIVALAAEMDAYQAFCDGEEKLSVYAYSDPVFMKFQIGGYSDLKPMATYRTNRDARFREVFGSLQEQDPPPDCGSADLKFQQIQLLRELNELLEEIDRR